MLNRHPPVVVQHYQRQARAAEEHQRSFFRRLEAEGWKETLPGHWTNPKFPGQEISL